MKNLKISLFTVMTLILVAIFSNSCSSVKIFKEFGEPKGELAVYVGYTMAMSQGDLHNNNITIGFKNHFDLNPDGGMTIGRCHPHINEISINRQYWVYATHTQKLLLIAHELNHCVCYTGHVVKKFKDGCPSYMSTMQPSEQCMKANLNAYMEEIKKGCDL